MTALELRLIAYGLTALLVIGGSGWAGYTLAAHHYQRIMAQEAADRAKVVEAQQQATIAELKAEQTATEAAEKQYVDLKARSDDLSARLADSVRAYQGLRTGIVSAQASTAALADAARQGAASTGELASLVRQAVAACSDDAAALTALQTWASQK